MLGAVVAQRRPDPGALGLACSPRKRRIRSRWLDDRDAGDLPADGQPLEEELDRPLPRVLAIRAGSELLTLAIVAYSGSGAGLEGAAQAQEVAVGVDVVGCRARGAWPAAGGGPSASRGGRPVAWRGPRSQALGQADAAGRSRSGRRPSRSGGRCRPRTRRSASASSRSCPWRGGARKQSIAVADLVVGAELLVDAVDVDLERGADLRRKTHEGCLFHAAHYDRRRLAITLARMPEPITYRIRRSAACPPGQGGRRHRTGRGGRAADAHARACGRRRGRRAAAVDRAPPGRGRGAPRRARRPRGWVLPYLDERLDPRGGGRCGPGSTAAGRSCSSRRIRGAAQRARTVVRRAAREEVERPP